MFLSDEKLKLNDIYQEKGTSIWLSTLRLKDEGYREIKVWMIIITTTSVMRLWSSKRCTTCFSLQKRRLHDHIRNLTTELLRQVNKDVKIEPVLQSLTGENFEQLMSNTNDDAQLGIIILKCKGL